ncbi:hypothetical protein FEE95_21295 [Maribacter algarum]|uniref:DUF3108 domain-containing protein n=1 Tax=Maribacter algarum (ex Zhang et al. 2020) TaxID=2578118 RepID=A0A5S3PE57_9FLAO|nr:hypothetical protein [Maribacter algarum]TMM52225.1 hypothetical protein FEE95_21295 [Maribacter algarum]
MKKALLAFTFILIAFNSTFAQDFCSKYYPMKEGSSFTYDIYNKKDKLDGTTNYLVTNVVDQGGVTQATMQIKYSDAKGKQELDSDYKISCTGKGIKIDFISLMPRQMLDQYKDMDMEIDMTGTDIELPNNLEVGQQLAEANVVAKMNMSGIKMNIEVNTIDRKVLSKETVTTPAGTFECYVLIETIASKTMGANIQINSKTWLSEGIGMVKNETYSKKGNVNSKTVLAKFSK